MKNLQNQSGPMNRALVTLNLKAIFFRPRNPIPFEKSKYPDSKSRLSMSMSRASTWNDASGTAIDSMDYSGYDTSTMMRKEDDQNEQRVI
jgi:hypothetical protein